MMKKGLLILVLLSKFAFAVEIDEQITDIYFGNGVWNDNASAKNGRNELSEETLQSIYNGDVNEFKKHHFTRPQAGAWGREKMPKLNQTNLVFNTRSLCYNHNTTKGAC